MHGARPPVILLTALPAEARTLIEHLGLEPAGGDHAFPVFVGDDGLLVVTGIGRIRAAAGAAYALGAFVPGEYQSRTAWINVGLAGHAEAPLGSVFWAHTITDAATGRRGHPQATFRYPVGGSALCTFDRPCTEYRKDELCDMEASAIWEFATRVSSSELVHCIKVVSDSASDPIVAESTAHWSRPQVDAWMHATLPAVDAAIKGLRAAADALGHEAAMASPSEEDYAWCLQKWRFSQTLRMQVRDLLRRRALLVCTPLDRASLLPCRSAREVIDEVRREYEALVLRC